MDKEQIKRILLLRALASGNEINADTFGDEKCNELGKELENKEKATAAEEKLKQALLLRFDETLETKKQANQNFETTPEGKEFNKLKGLIESPDPAALDKLIAGSASTNADEVEEFTKFAESAKKLLDLKPPQPQQNVNPPGTGSSGNATSQNTPSPPPPPASSDTTKLINKWTRTPDRIKKLLGVEEGGTKENIITKAKDITQKFNELDLPAKEKKNLTGKLPVERVDFTNAEEVEKEVNRVLGIRGLGKYRSDQESQSDEEKKEAAAVRDYVKVRLVMGTMNEEVDCKKAAEAKDSYYELQLARVGEHHEKMKEASEKSHSGKKDNSKWIAAVTGKNYWSDREEARFQEQLKKRAVLLNDGLYVTMDDDGEEALLMTEVTPSNIKQSIEYLGDCPSLLWTNIPESQQRDVENACLKEWKHAKFRSYRMNPHENLISRAMPVDRDDWKG